MILKKQQNELTLCPICKKGKLTIKFSPKFKRSFVACNAYPDCKTTFSLPPNRLIKKADKICDKCNFPLLLGISKGRRPWMFCFNPQCPSRQEGSFAVAKKEAAPSLDVSEESKEENSKEMNSDND